MLSKCRHKALLLALCLANAQQVWAQAYIFYPCSCLCYFSFCPSSWPMLSKCRPRPLTSVLIPGQCSASVHNTQTSADVSPSGPLQIGKILHSRHHRVHRVPGFLSIRPNWLHRPLTRKRVLPPPLVPRGLGYIRLRESGRGEPIRTKGQTVW
jgi:hypothetical protein